MGVGELKAHLLFRGIVLEMYVLFPCENSFHAEHAFFYPNQRLSLLKKKKFTCQETPGRSETSSK